MQNGVYVAGGWTPATGHRGALSPQSPSCFILNPTWPLQVPPATHLGVAALGVLLAQDGEALLIEAQGVPAVTNGDRGAWRC